jgi:hypothetical protein
VRGTLTPDISRVCGDLLGHDGSTLVQNLRGQLGAATTDERHAFLFVRWEHAALGPFIMRSDDLPVEPPTLPHKPTKH